MYFDFDGCKHLFWWLEYSIYVCINVYHKTFYCKCFWNTHTQIILRFISVEKNHPLSQPSKKNQQLQTKLHMIQLPCLLMNWAVWRHKRVPSSSIRFPSPWGEKKPRFFGPLRNRGWLVGLIGYIYIYWFIFFISDVIVLQGGPTEPDKSYKWS